MTTPHTFLRRYRLFDGLSPEEQHELVRISRPFTFQPGEEIFQEGDRANGVYLVETGSVEISTRLIDPDRRVILRTLGDGAIIGDVALIDEGRRSASATAVTTTAGFRLDGRSFRRLRRAHHPAATKVLRQIAVVLTARLRQLTERLTRQPAQAGAPPSPALSRGAPLTDGQQRQVRGFPFFSDFDDRSCQALLSVLTVCTVPSGQAIFTEGSRGTTCYFLVSGEIDVEVTSRGRSRLLTTLPPGTLLGQLALIDSHPRSATCRAASDSVLLQLDRAAFTGLLESDSLLASQFIYALDTVLAEMLRRATLQMRQLEAQLEKKRMSLSSQPFAELQELAKKSRSLSEIMRHLELSTQDIDMSQVKVEIPGLD